MLLATLKFNCIANQYFPFSLEIHLRLECLAIEACNGYPKLCEIIFFENQNIQILTVTTFWRGFDSLDGKFIFLLFLCNLTKVGPKKIYIFLRKKHVIIIKLLIILAKFLNWDDSELKICKIL
jgi:hypothetical protein